MAVLQYEMIAERPYEFTSEEVLFEVFAQRNGIEPAGRPAARAASFAKPRACLRASPLGRRYGWGIHHDSASRVGLIPLGSEEYVTLAQDESLAQVRAMRSRRA